MLKDFLPQRRFWLLLAAAVVGGLLLMTIPLLLLGLLGFMISVFIAKKVLRDPFFGVLCIAFFLPFERIGALEVVGVTVRIHQVLAVLTMCSYLVHSSKQSDFQLKGHPIVWLTLLFWLSMVGSLLNATNVTRGIMVYAFTVFTMAVSLMVLQLVDSRRKAIKVFKTLVLSGGLVCLFGIYQWIGDQLGLPASLTGIRWWYHKEVLGVARLQSTALEPLYFANYLLVVLPSVLTILFLSQRRIASQEQNEVGGSECPQRLFEHIESNTFALGSVAALMGVALLLTTSRGGLAGMLLAGVVIVFFKYSDLIKQWVRVTVVAVGTLLLLLFVVTAAGSAESSLKFIIDQSTRVLDTSADQERLDSYQTTLSGIGLKPWLGHGPGQFGVYAASGAQSVPEGGWDIVNNEYLELLFETGVFGFSIMMLIFGAWVIENLRAQRLERDPHINALLVGTLAGFVGILLQYLTFSTLYIMHVWFLMGFGMALQRISVDPGMPVSSSERKVS